MSRHSTPASSRAICTASAPMSKADLSPKRPNGWRPTPMMATSSIARSSALVAAGGDRRELEGHDLVTVGVDVEGSTLQLDVHAEAELVGVALEIGRASCRRRVLKYEKISVYTGPH